MAYVYFNPNPLGKNTNDCVVRALCLVLNQSWDQTYDELSMVGKELCEPFNSDTIWWTYLKRKGFFRAFVPDRCPDCYSVKEFCFDHPIGRFVIKASKHVIAVIDGDYYDTWDSGKEIPLYFVTRS